MEIEIENVLLTTQERPIHSIGGKQPHINIACK